MQAADELKECPFCGFKNSLFLSGKINAATYGEQPRVVCMNCGTNGPLGKTFYEAKYWWNRREGRR
jgi:Lar family restriction alleviation protein